MSIEDRDEELMQRARDCGLAEWLPGDLFAGSAVPFWAVTCLARLVAAGRIERRQTARASLWKYAIVPPPEKG